MRPRLNVSRSKVGARRAEQPQRERDRRRTQRARPSSGQPPPWTKHAEPEDPGRRHGTGRRLLQLLELERQVARGLESILFVLLETPPHDGGGHRRQAGVERERIRGLRMHDGVHRLERRLALKRALAGEHLVQHRAEREDVGAVIDRLAAHLLGRHVAGRAVKSCRLAGGVDVCLELFGSGSLSFAMPKSRSFARQSFVMNTLAGLTSRCQMFFRCAASSALAICTPISTALRNGSSPGRSLSRSVSPSSSSVTTNGMPFSVPTS